MSYETIQQGGKCLLPSLISDIPSLENMFQYTSGYTSFSVSNPAVEVTYSELLRTGCIDEKKVIEIDVYGTCLSFTTIDDCPWWLKVKNMIRQHSVLGVCTPPVEIDEECVVESYNHMDKSEVIKYFCKNDILQWMKEPAEYIFLDLMIEKDVIGILDFGGKYVSYSWTLSQSRIAIPPNLPYILCRPMEIPKEQMFIYLDQFADLLKSLYQEEHIIIHKGEFSSFHMRSDQIYYIGESNYNKGMSERLDEYYDYLRQRLPNAYFIDVYRDFASRNFIFTSEHPAHYQKEFYKAVSDKVIQHIRHKERGSI